MRSRNNSVKYTTVLPAEYIAGLKQLVSENVITSINQGIRYAVEDFITQKRKELYNLQMAEASKDSGFLERTTTAQKDFEFADTEVTDEW